MAPCILGDHGRGVVHLPTMQNMADKKTLKMRKVRQVGSDLKLVFETYI
jgi:diaminohydroxyphosphoribosylaminopyrimidine deaminase/5-amino-6-(5-phosphoribosylamino)uracil reductase